MQSEQMRLEFLEEVGLETVSLAEFAFVDGFSRMLVRG